MNAVLRKNQIEILLVEDSPGDARLRARLHCPAEYALSSKSPLAATRSSIW